MIPVTRPKEPADFDKDVRTPGKQWLTDNPGAPRPSPLWNKCSRELADHYANLCAYAAMLDPTGGTVDHYLSYKHYPGLTYEWSNYR